LNNKPFSRSERVSQQVLKTINDILTREMDLRKYGFITFSSVKMTADLKHATLYYSVLNPTKKIEIINEELNLLVPVFRKFLSVSLNLRSTPTLKFFYDDSFEQFEKIDKLIKEID
jgi:ribosome-binding factor A